ncbi:MAG: TetR/AcrR family transcriptional regulator [Pseudolysinimonas sp.]|uniref:TetR/AcrR family transcriptional regulator n=1 Tax=Pseudolysinimonas sp. TaxID=2680009 RepID=UPI003266FA44
MTLIKPSTSTAHPTPPTSATTRMRVEDRRELVITAAMAVFGERGYVGATTDAVAKAAGVSQPYVVRMFGTKEALFLAVLHRAVDRLLTDFTAVIDANPDSDTEQLRLGLGNAYGDLLADRGLLLSLMHAFVAGSDPAIGATARAAFLSVYSLLRSRARFTAEEARDFLAHGMMLNTMVGMRMGLEIDDPVARELVECVSPINADLIVRLATDR